MKCKNCHWFTGNAIAGPCRRHAPIPVCDETHLTSPGVGRNPYPDEVEAVWPYVGSDEFCGDWKEKVKK